ncbi:hypothetical protein OKW21_003341 [Catalinimonas alkaloidigena]|uniref:hypothetical protein n=1 Tax=Catalinimonas alkaloidigena TaxID=1075417 RepID=UPI00240725E4|nr:hypothetical protein [Catalinimonas alkaloidigena]MDF9798078.1 hypothetical protein [Catalinimonas alkaloidigena]
MKTQILLMLTLLLSFCIQLVAQQHPLVGTWQMISSKVIDVDGNEILQDNSNAREIKIITPTHFMFIAHDIKDDSLIFKGSIAGTVNVEGDRYIESPIYSSAEEYNHFKTNFSWQVDGDQFIQRGTITLADGSKVILKELVFQRVNSTEQYVENPSVGVWDQLSSSYTLADGTQESHTNAIATRFQIITSTHWMRISHRNNEFENAMGGRYTLENVSEEVNLEDFAPGYGGKHTSEITKLYPQLEYASFSVNPEEKYEFIQRVEDDKLYISGFGKDAEGNKILSFEDIFQKVNSHANGTTLLK